MFKEGGEGAEKHRPKVSWNNGRVDVEVGPHPNETTHHISWVAVFHEKDGRIRELGRTYFGSHDDVKTTFKTSFYVEGIQGGRIIAVAYCNIHGLWKNEITL